MAIILDRLSNILKILLPLAIIACSRASYNPKLVDYLHAEKRLRERIGDGQILGDSIKVLQHQYHVDVTKALSTLSNNPEALLKLLKELRIEK